MNMEKKTDMETKMWSYKLVWDTMFAPNPLFNVLTLATCKPTIRKSPNTIEGMWIAGWTACTLHNSPLEDYRVQHCNKHEEELIYLARIDEILPLNEYWVKYPEKRCVKETSVNDARWYGDNIYHLDENCILIQSANNSDHNEEAIKRDYYNGKNALICKRFYYFTPDKRIKAIPAEFQELIHGGIGQSIKAGKLVDNFINFVSKCAMEEGVTNGIVGNLPIEYPTSDNIPIHIIACKNKRKGGCSK